MFAFAENENKLNCYGSSLEGIYLPLQWYDSSSLVPAKQQLQVYQKLWASGENPKEWENITE